MDNILNPRQTITVFPNPTNSSIHFQLKENEEGQVLFYNSIGQMVLEKNIYKGQLNYEWSLDELDKGIYFYAVFSKNKIIQQGKIIKVE